MIDFKNTYNQDEILDFLKNSFLKDFQKDIRAVDIRDKKDIQKAYYLGYSPELELSVFEFLHEGGTEKRVALTTEAFNILRDSGNFKAIGIFYSKDTVDWRFSLLTATPVVDEKGKVKTILSNPKRYSFLLGPNAKVNTPTRFLINKGEIQSFDDLKERFSIEVVNKEFYREISKLFIQLVGGTLRKGKNQGEYKALLELPGIKDSSQTAQEFAVRLIGRLIFCWFLREKKNGTQQSLMPHSLLSLEASVNHKNYYHNILEPIFFKVLNVPLSSRKEEKYVSDPYDKIPYLNGGLFSPHDDDFYSTNESKQEDNNKKVVVPDKWLQELFEILETYNFTIDENSAFDEELSIDPEMLGRIFENLLAEINPETGESARKSTGSYYTPRVIVDYMVDESLYLYLKNKTDIEEEKLRSLISYDLDDDTHTPLMEDEKEKIIAAIDELKILDPACGSGAFPMGILQKIVFILQQLDPNGQYWFRAQLKGISPELKKNLERENKEKNFDYIRKLGVIRKNIFGIDIQPIATEISRLRCFLTLVVDQKVDDKEVNRGIQPLPNLDFKFVTANSLISLPLKEEYGQKSLLQDESGIEELKDLREQFFNASVFEKESLIVKFLKIQRDMALRNSKDSVAEYTKYLTEWDPFSHNTTTWFDSEWMFGIKNGFDIVIGNPPYIQLQDKEKNLATLYKNLNFEVFERSGDIYCLFYEKAKLLLNNEGALTFITSNKWMRLNYGEKLRNFLISKFSLYALLDFRGVKVFNEVTVDTNILIAINKEQDKHLALRACNIDSDYNPAYSIREYFCKKSICLDIPQKGQKWVIVSEEERQLLNKIIKTGKPLEERGVRINYGIKTGFNKAFIIGEDLKDELIEKDPSLRNIIKIVVRGRDGRNFYSKLPKQYLINTHNGVVSEGVNRINALNSPALMEHLGEYEEKLKARQDQGDHWTNLRSCSYLGDFEKWKIAYPVINRKWSFICLEPGVYILAPMRFISANSEEELFYICAILGSKLIQFYWKHFGSMQDDNGYQMDTYVMSKVPVVNSKEEDKKNLVNIVKEIIAKKKLNEDTKRQYEEINFLIYRLYSLSTEDIRLVEETIAS